MELNSPIILALIAAVPSFILGILAWRRSVKVDKNTEQAATALAQSTAAAQVLEGLNKLIENLQEDNKELRGNITEVAKKLKEALAERDKLRRELDKLNKRYKIKKVV